MKPLSRILFFCICAPCKTQIFVFLLLFSILTKAQNAKPIAGQYIVILKESAATPVIKKQKKNDNREQKFNDNKPERDKNMAKLKEVRQRKNINESLVLADYGDVTVGFAAKLTEKEKKDLESDPDIEGVYQDHSFDIGPFTPEINSIQSDNSSGNPTMTSGQKLGCNITNAGGSVDGSLKNTCIWIMDTGLDMDHPDLNIETTRNLAVSFVPRSTVEDIHGHGTHCAGIAAAKNNSIGVVGVSAGAKLVPVKVMNDYGTGEWSWMLAGLDHIAKYDISGDVVNMSLGGFPFNDCENVLPALKDAIKALGAAGTWVIMAAGNDYGDAARSFPGCVNGTRILTVGSILCSKECSPFSNFSSNVVDWVAIGTNVYSTYKNGGYTTKSGTSMATPAVAGIVHSKNGYPNSGGTVACRSHNYKIAVR